MPTRSYAIRLDDDIVAKIKQFQPDFDRHGRAKGKNTDVLKELIKAGLGTDPSQHAQQELAELKQELRDINHSITEQRKNLSVVLELVLRNVGGKPEQVTHIIGALQQKGMIF